MLVTGLQPTGSIHIGNYLGAILPAIALESEQKIIFIADYHAITAGHDPKVLAENTDKLTAMLIASGVKGSVEGSHIFKQSALPAHTELAWILSATAARVGWLNRMTQFKLKASSLYEQHGCTPQEFLMQRLAEIAEASWRPDGSMGQMRQLAQRTLNEVNAGTNSEGPSVGLYTYPVLQAADILLYQATEVPVGDDQAQHLNLTVDIAEKFNRTFGDVFKVPRAVVSPTVKRIMSLTDPTKKMSKSDPNPDSCIMLEDEPDDIRRKVKRATSDSDLIPDNLDALSGRDGLTNMLTIYSAFTDKTLSESLSEFSGSGYGKLKPALSEAIIEGLRPVRRRYTALMKDREEIYRTLWWGKLYAEQIASKTLQSVREAIGVGP